MSNLINDRWSMYHHLVGKVGKVHKLKETQVANLDKYFSYLLETTEEVHSSHINKLLTEKLSEKADALSKQQVPSEAKAKWGHDQFSGSHLSFSGGRSSGKGRGDGGQT